MESRQVGLSNLGNTCYLNAVLQCLSKIRIFSESILNSDCCFVVRFPLRLTVAFVDVLRQIARQPASNRQFAPEKLLQCLSSLDSFEIGLQHDSHELLVFLLDTIRGDIMTRSSLDCSSSIEGYTRSRTYFVDQLFSFDIVFTRTCTKCKTVSTSSNPSFDLSVPIPMQRVNKKSSLKPDNDKETLQNCILKFLSGTEVQYTCKNKCEEKTAVETVFLRHLPPVLIIHLKRFQTEFLNEVFRMRKIQKGVTYPLKLDMEDESEKVSYDLTGVVLHQGSANSGHYTAINKVDNRWFLYNDSCVSSIEESQVVSDQAYLLFYKMSEKMNFKMKQVYKQVSSCDTSERRAALNTAASKISETGSDLDIVGHSQPTVISQNSAPAVNSSHKNEALKNNAPHSTVTKAVQYFNSLTTKPLAVTLNVSLNRQTSNMENSGATNYTNPFQLRQNVSLHNQTFNNTQNASSKYFCNTNVEKLTKSNDKLKKANNSNTLNSSTGLFPLFPAGAAKRINSLPHDKITSNSEIQRSSNAGCCEVISDIDILDPPMTEDDVPGSKLKLSKLYYYRRKELEFWLECRGLPKTGSKTDLIHRIGTHAERGKAGKIDPRVGGGKYYKKKRKRMAQLSTGNRPPIIPITGWRPFPSIDIPHGFNVRVVQHYLIDSVGDVFPLEEEDAEWEQLEEEESPQCPLSFPRAQQFLDSGHVVNTMDVMRGDHYFVKAQVRASMAKKNHVVTITLCNMSGTICEATCNTCKQSPFGRCSHVGAVLLSILKQIDEDGYEAVTCTGRECSWGKGATARNPGPVMKKSYNPSRDMKRRISHDPRPKALRQWQDDHAEENINTLVEKLRALSEPSLIAEALDHEYTDYVEDASDLDNIAQQCSLFFRFLNEIKHEQKSPYEIENTIGQNGSMFWHSQRCIRVTASEAKRILGLSQNSSRMKFLRMHMWGLDRVQVRAMRYGQESEDVARKQYETVQKEKNPNFKVNIAGIMVNPEFPGLSCSPDGVAVCDSDIKLIEIKAPMVLEDADPNDFHSVLTQKQLKTFILYRDELGNICVRKTHKWYYQMQMSLDIMSLTNCDLIIWSKKGILIIPVIYDEEFWLPKRRKLIQIHRELFVPEIFAMRTPRSLPPIILEYPEWHEDEMDLYFYDITFDPDELTEILLRFANTSVVKIV